MPVTEEEMAALLDRPFPGGTVTIDRWENTLFCDAMGIAPPDGDIAHPAFLFHLPLRGAGLEIADLLALGRAESDEAVRAGEYRWDLHQPLRVGVPYRVTGRVVAVERKRGRRAGLMDAVTFRIEMHAEPSGDPVAATETTCLFLRSE